MEKSFGRGDIIWTDFTPTEGHEQSGKRPALVLSPKAYNQKVGLAIVCPITSKSKGYPFEVPIKGRINGAILVDQIRTIDWKVRKSNIAATATKDTMRQVADILGLLLPK